MEVIKFKDIKDKFSEYKKFENELLKLKMNMTPVESAKIENPGVIMLEGNKIAYCRCGKCHNWVLSDHYCSHCGAKLQK